MNLPKSDGCDSKVALAREPWFADLRELADAEGIRDTVDDATGEHYRVIVTPDWRQVALLLDIVEAAQEVTVGDPAWWAMHPLGIALARAAQRESCPACEDGYICRQAPGCIVVAAEAAHSQDLSHLRVRGGVESGAANSQPTPEVRDA